MPSSKPQTNVRISEERQAGASSARQGPQQMTLREGSRVVLLQSLRLPDGAINAGARGTVKRKARRNVVIVRLDSGRTLSIEVQMLGDDPLQSSYYPTGTETA